MDQSQSTAWKRRGLDVKTTHAYRRGRGLEINCNSSTLPENAFLKPHVNKIKYVNKKPQHKATNEYNKDKFKQNR